MHVWFWDLWAYGQYPEAGLDGAQYDEQVSNMMGPLAPFFFAKESGRSIRDQVERRNTAARNITKTRADRIARVAIEPDAIMEKYLDATTNFPKLKVVAQRTVTRAVDDARKALGGRAPKRIYRNRKKFRSK